MTGPLASLALGPTESSAERLLRLRHRSAALRSAPAFVLTAAPMLALFVAGFSSLGWASAFGLAGIVPIALAGFVFGTEAGCCRRSSC